MNKPFPALCRDCLHQLIDPFTGGGSRCSHPKVNAKNEWALANTGGDGSPAHSDARTERGKTSFLAPCGQSGKLWEPKLPNTTAETRQAAQEGNQ